jgi:hypothetical protein
MTGPAGQDLAGPAERRGTVYALTVGKPYIEGKTGWPEAVEYNYRGGAHELRLFYPDLRPAEVADVQEGPARFAFAVAGDVIFFCWKFGGQPWSDSTYSIHLVPEDERQAPPDWQAAEARAALTVILVEAKSGLVAALRYVSFSPDFTRRLHAAIRKQYGQPWPGDDDYLAQAKRIYAQYQSDRIASALALARCKGGD